MKICFSDYPKETFSNLHSWLLIEGAVESPRKSRVKVMGVL